MGRGAAADGNLWNVVTVVLYSHDYGNLVMNVHWGY